MEEIKPGKGSIFGGKFLKVNVFTTFSAVCKIINIIKDKRKMFKSSFILVR